jgi:hypothetical protein
MIAHAKLFAPFLILSILTLLFYPASGEEEVSRSNSVEVPIENAEIFLEETPSPKEITAAENPTRAEEADLTSAPISTSSGEPAGHFVDQVVLGALDKVTARVSHVPIRVNGSAQFGTIAITLRKCWRAAPEEPPETKAFLEIRETKPGKPATRIFKGWMFASNPSVVTLEHPVYDVWVTHRLDAALDEKSQTKDEAAQKLDQLLDKLLNSPED